MVDIVSALAATSQAVAIVRDLREIDRAVDAAAYKLKIAELTSVMADIKLALTDAKGELALKDAEIDRLKKQFQRSADTVEYNGFKYDKGPDGKPTGSAYCPVCEQKEALFFHLNRIAVTDTCPNCKTHYKTMVY